MTDILKRLSELFLDFCFCFKLVFRSRRKTQMKPAIWIKDSIRSTPRERLRDRLSLLSVVSLSCWNSSEHLNASRREKVQEKRRGMVWPDIDTQVWSWHWLEMPSWALLSRTWQIYATKLVLGPGLSWARNGASELSWADAKFENEEKSEGCGMWLLSGLPHGQSQAALGSLGFSVFRGCSWILPPASSHQQPHPGSNDPVKQLSC